MTAKNKMAKLISTFLIVSILSPAILFSAPKQAMAQPGATAAFSVPVADIPQETAGWLSQALHVITSGSTVTNTTLHIKDFAQFLLQQILMRVAKATLARITQATINWINSDFHGSPLFLENPESFFRDIAKSEVRNLVDMIGYDSFRFPFGRQTALNVINSYKSQLYINAQYTLSKVINDPRLLVRYRNDFNYGGWNGFLINTQYPQNNYLGFQGIIQQNLASRLEGTLQAPAQKVQNLLQQGMGFLSPQTCPSNPKYNNGINEFLKPSFKTTVAFDPPEEYEIGDDGTYTQSQARFAQYEKEYNAAIAADKTMWAEKNYCPGGLVNTTPGSVVGNHIMDAMGSNLRQTELGAALGNSLSAIFDALLNHFLDKGLNALADTVSPSPSDDNWSYEDQRLGGNYIVTSAPSLNVPQNVSVRVGQTTSTAIFGGTGNYTIEPKVDPTGAIIATIDTKISAGGASSSKLSVMGIAPINPSDKSTRTATFVVKDQSDQIVKPVTVNVKVYAIGVLAVTKTTNCIPLDINKNCVVTDTNTPFFTSIEGGTEPYSIATGPGAGPDIGIAIVTLDPDSGNLIITGVGSGKTFVTIKDSANYAIRVDIEIGGVQNLSIQPYIVAPFGKSMYEIKGGTPKFEVENVSDPSVATATIVDIAGTSESGNFTSQYLEINGKSGGTSAVTIKDQSAPVKRAGAIVNVVSGAATDTLKADPLGICFGAPIIVNKGAYSEIAGISKTNCANISPWMYWCEGTKVCQQSKPARSS